MDPADNKEIIVAIKCITYNHEHYIRQCLEGIVEQQTNYRFVAVVHDDASTDNTQAIIREYEKRYPDIIKPIYEIENQHSKHDGSMTRIVNEAIDATGCKYIALCEGDDFWIDPLKLQKQVDFMEAHPDYSMVCSDAVIMSPQRELDYSRFRESSTVPFKKMIAGGGLYVQTATLLFRRELMKDYPKCCEDCHVGDYPLQLYMGIKGKVYYFAEKMATYRINTGNSWTAIQSRRPIEVRIKGWRSEVDMLNGLDELSDYAYTETFQKRIAKYVYHNIYANHEYAGQILDSFSDIRIAFSPKKRFYIRMIKSGLYPVLHYFRKMRHKAKKSLKKIFLQR